VLTGLLALRSNELESLNDVLRRVLAEYKDAGAKTSQAAHDRVVSAANVGSSSVRYLLGEEEHGASDATEAMIAILGRLAQMDGNFFDMLAARVRGRTRNHLARLRADVYPERPDLARYVKEVAPGWFIGCNIANREKEKILREACKVAGLTFGRDLKIDMTNA
jgi:negative regulator of replication initiation